MKKIIFLAVLAFAGLAFYPDVLGETAKDSTLSNILHTPHDLLSKLESTFSQLWHMFSLALDNLLKLLHEQTKNFGS